MRCDRDWRDIFLIFVGIGILYTIIYFFVLFTEPQDDFEDLQTNNLKDMLIYSE
jgi:hypothetical protein